jgi:hypothetical protein
MPRGTEQLPVAAAVGAVGGSLPRSRHGLPSAADAATWSKVWAHQPAVAVAVAVEGVRTPITPFVVLSASSVRRMDVRPLVGQASGVQATGVHATVRSGCPDGHASSVRVRCIGTVRTALDPGVRRCGGVAHPWAHRVGDVAVVRERLGRRSPSRRCPNRAWRGRDGRSLAVRGSHGSTAHLAAASPAHRLRRLADHGRWFQRQGAGRLAGEHEKEQVLPSLQQVRPGSVAGVMPAMGYTGRWGPRSVVVVLVLVPCCPAPEGPSGSAGSRLRPRCGRGTCSALSAPSGSTLTCKNSSGRDRV